MSDTVTVSVQLPKIEGYEYVGYRKPQIGEWLVDLDGRPVQKTEEFGMYIPHWILRPIQSKTVMVELTAEAVRRFRDGYYNTNDMEALNAACTTALAKEARRVLSASNTDIDKREKCGVWLHLDGAECGQRMHLHHPEVPYDRCALSAGHERPHRAEPEKCGYRFCPDHDDCNHLRCTLPKDHEGTLHRAS